MVAFLAVALYAVERDFFWCSIAIYQTRSPGFELLCGTIVGDGTLFALIANGSVALHLLDRSQGSRKSLSRLWGCEELVDCGFRQ